MKYLMHWLWCHTCNQEAVVLLYNDCGQIVHTRMCLCHQEVKFGTGQTVKYKVLICI